MTDIIQHLSTALAGRYRIERQLGEGGMATVYLAEDLKHDRKVALKVLRPELGVVLGADRFLQEIKTTARLQHPHVLPLYDSGSTVAANGGTGLLYYVMPYIEGETLRTKLDREQQLGIDEAVRIATEVADALQHAHELGVIHRDIKPENILLRNGRAFVADFGIALAVSAAAGGRMTETGLSLGTPHYMSPEQATADKHVNGRSDIYSLGSVLYEMLTGEPPHTGPSAQAIILKIVSDAARPVRDLRKAVPPHVAAAISMALEKLPADRFDTAQAFAEALRNPSFTTHHSGANAAAPSRAPSRRYALPAMVGVTVLALAIAGWALTKSRATATTVARYTTSLGAEGALDGITFAVEAALSPDGSMLVYRSPLNGPGQLYLKRRDEVVARPITGTENGSGPFFSPDGQSIGFVANGQLRRIPVTGGTSLKLADSVNAQYNRAAWLEDNSIIFYDATSRTLRRVRAGETKPQVIVSREMLEGRFPWLPSPLPGSRGVLFTAHQTNCVGPVSCRPSRVYVFDAERNSIRLLFEDAIGAWYVNTGHVLYLTSGGTLMAAAWDNASLETTGTPAAVLDGVQAPGFQVASDGTAFYLVGRSEFSPGPVPNAMVVWVDRSGNVTPVDSTWQVNTGGTYSGDDAELDWGLALSPDGRRIALTLLTELGTDIWIKQLPAGPASRLTLYKGVDRSPVWTSDGRSVTFLSDRPASGTAAANALHVWEQSADGIGEPRLLWAKENATEVVRSRDGRWIVMGTRTGTGTTGERHIVAVQPGVDSAIHSLASTGVDVSGAALSPDSRWIAYVSNEQGTNEVFVRPFPDVNSGKWQVSSGGGGAPVWAHSGRELYYVANGKMQAARVSGGATFSAEAPRALFTIPAGVRSRARTGGTFVVSQDDQRFLMVRDNKWDDMAGTPSLVVVHNFFDELRAKVKR